MRQIDTYWQGGSQSNSRTLIMTDNLPLAGTYAQIELDIDLEDKVYTTDGTSVLKTPHESWRNRSLVSRRRSKSSPECHHNNRGWYLEGDRCASQTSLSTQLEAHCIVLDIGRTIKLLRSLISPPDQSFTSSLLYVVAVEIERRVFGMRSMTAGGT